ncbi:hypothetical protein LZC95_43390 [Pendulispora brunnea]|uniref:Co-chaperone DjlA N-terminal domain-containing protein n=1 Tax=Pendulispora brunnea TaxID=2905690 RepID=A0ABZ2K3J6_9BACT
MDATASDISPIEARFMHMLSQIFEDGIITDDERVALWTEVATGGLAASQVDGLLLHFLQEQFAGFAADGIITNEERTRLRLMVDVLGIAAVHLPDEIRRALHG